MHVGRTDKQGKMKMLLSTCFSQKGIPKIKPFAVQVRGAMEIALFIQNIQEERAEVKKSETFTKLMMKYN